MQLACSDDNRVLTHLATSKAVSQGRPSCWNFALAFCTSSVEMEKWFRILKSTKCFFYSCSAFKGTCGDSTVHFSIPSQRLFVFTSLTDIARQKQQQRKTKFALLFSPSCPSSYISLSSLWEDWRKLKFACLLYLQGDSAWLLAIEILFMIWNAQ